MTMVDDLDRIQKRCRNVFEHSWWEQVSPTKDNEQPSVLRRMGPRLEGQRHAAGYKGLYAVGMAVSDCLRIATTDRSMASQPIRVLCDR